MYNNNCHHVYSSTVFKFGHTHVVHLHTCTLYLHLYVQYYNYVRVVVPLAQLVAITITPYNYRGGGEIVIRAARCVYGGRWSIGCMFDGVCGFMEHE